MTDERMTQGDVRLREELVQVLSRPVHTAYCNFEHDGYAGTCGHFVDMALAPEVERIMDQAWVAGYEAGEANAECRTERIVASRVGEVVERAAVHARDMSGGCRCGWDYNHSAPDMLSQYQDHLRAALRAADAPLGGQERDGGHGGAGGDAGAGDGE